MDMNIIRLRREEREKKISEVMKTIEPVEEPDYKKLEIVFSSKWGMSKRTVKEYIQIAKYKLRRK